MTEIIGRGESSVVCAISDTTVVRKSLHVSKNEVILMAADVHPSILRATRFYIGEDGTFCTEMPRGTPFDKTQLNEIDLMTVYRQVADGLEALHQTNAIHGDIVESNVVIFDNLDARIIDFGISCACGVQLDSKRRYPIICRPHDVSYSAYSRSSVPYSYSGYDDWWCLMVDMISRIIPENFSETILGCVRSEGDGYYQWTLRYCDIFAANPGTSYKEPLQKEYDAVVELMREYPLMQSIAKEFLTVDRCVRSLREIIYEKMQCPMPPALPKIIIELDNEWAAMMPLEMMIMAKCGNSMLGVPTS